MSFRTIRYFVTRVAEYQACIIYWKRMLTSSLTGNTAGKFSSMEIPTCYRVCFFVVLLFFYFLYMYMRTYKWYLSREERIYLTPGLATSRKLFSSFLTLQVHKRGIIYMLANWNSHYGKIDSNFRLWNLLSRGEFQKHSPPSECLAY